MPPNTDPLREPELWKTIIITLFILSLINERFVNFLKLNLQIWFPSPKTDKKFYLKASRWRKWIGRKLKLKNLYRPELENKEKEKEREGGITNLSVLCALLISVATGADLFIIIQGNLISYTDIWSRLNSLSFFEKLRHGFHFFYIHSIGFICTAFFISLGSKFWHDLLDVILYTSNIKRKLADFNTFSIETTEELDEFIRLTSNEITGFAIEQYKDLFASRKNVSYITQSRKLIGKYVRDCIVIYLKDNDDSNIPIELPVALPSGRKVLIPVFIIRNVKNIPHTLVTSGDFISAKLLDDRGTLCCGLTKNGINYLLTCYHVLSGNVGKMLFPDFIITDYSQQIDVNVEGLVRSVGKWCYGQRDQKLDIALVELKESMQNIYEPLLINKFPRTIIELESNDYIGKKQVTVLGDRSPNSKGFIVGFTRKPIKIQFGDGIYEMVELIEIADRPSHDTCLAITESGDSGALVIDDDNFPIGMVFAGNERFTYAIPMETILNSVKMDLLTL